MSRYFSSYNSYLDSGKSCCNISRGPAGPPGPTGQAGATVWKYGTGYTGPTGGVGPTGAPGGPVGPTGATGEPGAPGAIGATGEPGATGATGATGQPGYATPYAWGITQPIGQTGATGTVSFNFTGNTWDLNSYFSLRYGIRLTYDTVENSTGLYPYYNYYSGVMSVYPNIVPTTTGNPNLGVTGCQLNNAIDGNSSYIINPVTANAPSGRWYWVDYPSNPSGGATGAIPCPVYISGVTGTSVVFNFLDPMGGATGETYNYSASFEILQQGYGGTISSSGVNTMFTGASYATF